MHHRPPTNPAHSSMYVVQDTPPFTKPLRPEALNPSHIHLPGKQHCIQTSLNRLCRRLHDMRCCNLSYRNRLCYHRPYRQRCSQNCPNKSCFRQSSRQPGNPSFHSTLCHRRCARQRCIHSTPNRAFPFRITPSREFVSDVNSFQQIPTVCDSHVIGEVSGAFIRQSCRHAFLMELDPMYCDVIVKRWEEYTGQKAELAPGVAALC